MDCVLARPSVRDFLHRGRGDHLARLLTYGVAVPATDRTVPATRVYNNTHKYKHNPNFRMTKQGAHCPGLFKAPPCDGTAAPALSFGGGGRTGIDVDARACRVPSIPRRHHHRPGCYPLSRDSARRYGCGRVWSVLICQHSRARGVVTHTAQ